MASLFTRRPALCDANSMNKKLSVRSGTCSRGRVLPSRRTLIQWSQVNSVRWILVLVLCWPEFIQGAGLTWPANQLLPTFSTPAPVVDAIDVSSASSAEIDLFASLEGI